MNSSRSKQAEAPRSGNARLPGGRAFRLHCVCCVFWCAAQSAAGFDVNVDPSGHARHWELADPPAAVSSNVFNRSTRAIRYSLAMEGYSVTNRIAELNAVRAGFDQWQRVPGTALRFEESAYMTADADVNTTDQTNVIFWVKNTTFINGGRDNISGTLAVTFPRMDANNVVLEADIVLNGAQFEWFTDFDATESAARFVEATVLHEIGHFLGLDHSPVGGATMFARGATGVSTQAGLSSDEMAAVRTLYPAKGLSLGGMRGRVRIDGNGVFGATVIAEDADGNIASGTVTDAQGNFSMPGLLAGNYQVRVTPLDPASNVSLTRLVTGGDVAPAFAGANTAFLASPNRRVSVLAGATNTVDFTVAAGNPAFRLTRIQPVRHADEPLRAINSPATIRLGQSNVWIGICSPDGLSNGAVLSITGDGLTVGTPEITRDAFPGSIPPLNLISVSLSVAATATPGLRSFSVQQGTNAAYANGFLEILPPVPDFNFDGLDDRFQRRYFPLFTALEARPDADPDGDGSINGDEYSAGTNPMDALSALKIERVGREQSGALIAWRSEIGKRYQVLRSDAFGRNPWNQIGAALEATSTRTTFVDSTVTNQAGFYRVQVVP